MSLPPAGPRQLAFDLPARAAYGRADFFASPANRLALATVENWQNWPGGRLLLTGPAGAGKTHLAHIWAAETGATVLRAADLAGEDVDGLIRAGDVAVDGVCALAGQAGGETALFHLLNLATQQGRRVLLTARAAPRDWGLRLPDLLSRVQAMPAARLEAPDDALLSAVLVKLFADRQLAVPEALIPYLVARMERSIAAARDLVATLDALSLASRKPVSRAMAAKLLDNPDEAADNAGNRASTL